MEGPVQGSSLGAERSRLIHLMNEEIWNILFFFSWSALLDLIVVPRAGGALSCSEFRLPGP